MDELTQLEYVDGLEKCCRIGPGKYCLEISRDRGTTILQVENSLRRMWPEHTVETHGFIVGPILLRFIIVITQKE